MRIKILSFGIAKEICGGSVLRLEGPDNATAGAVKRLLTEQYPRHGGLGWVLLAADEGFAGTGTFLLANDELAVIPPVSGG